MRRKRSSRTSGRFIFCVLGLCAVWIGLSAAAEQQPRKIDQKLFRAVQNSDLSGVRRAIKQGANVNAAGTINDFTALMGAVNGEHVDAIKVLLSSGANINAKNRYGHPALTYAQRGRNQKIIQILKEAGAAE